MKLIPSGELILIRGAAGSGKSTLATTLKDFYEAVHLEADDYFRRDGEYKFDPHKLSSAHTWCQNRTLHSLNQGQTVIVANTFVYFNHIMDYIDIASATGASVVTMLLSISLSVIVMSGRICNPFITTFSRALTIVPLLSSRH